MRWLGSILLLAIAAAGGAGVAALPATAPATQPADPVARWVLQLADRDPAVRDEARENLMGLNLDQLTHLRQIISENRPLAPAQAVALREIVMQVFLAGQPYPHSAGGPGFLGVRSGAQGPDALVIVQPGVDPNPTGSGAVIAHRVPGFVAYRRLRDGDVIVGIQEYDEPIPDFRTFADKISQHFHSGETVHLKVQRGGRVIVVPITLDARPNQANDVENLRNEQMLEADKYWDNNFAPLVDPTAS